MPNWKECKLGDVATTTTTKISCSDITSNYISTENMLPDKGGIVAASSLPNSGNVSIYHKGDVLVSNIRPYFKKIWHATVDGAASNDVIVFHANEGVNSRYLYYTLADDNFFAYVMTGAKGTKMPRGDRKQILQYPVNLPSLEEQKRIAEILGSLDDKIELLQKQNKTLEDMAKALFKSWFVDFDVVRAKQKGLPKADIMREYHLTEELYDLFPSSFADSPLGPIPSGWEVKPLSKIAILIMGQSPAGTTYNETGEGIPFYQGRTDFGFRFPKKRIYCSAPTRIAEKGDILISVRAPVGDINMANETCCIGRGVASIRSNISKDSFLYYAMLSAQTQFDVFNTEGTVFGSINRKDLSSFSILTPIEQLVKEFNNIIGNFDLKIEENLKQIQTLTELRDTLLPRLISGKIRV